MKATTLLATAAFLATSASAAGPASPDVPPRLKGKPTKIDTWKWPNPFKTPSTKFTPACTASRTFPAREFLLDDLALDPPTGLLPYRDALKEVFSARQYPGSWDGIDPHGYDRNLLTMKYDEMPLRVREWIEEEERTGGEGKGLFAVYKVPAEGTRVLDTVKVPKESPVDEEWRERDVERLAVFAPGALYEVLPLWVAEGSGCEDSLMDLSKYSAELADGGVIAYPVHYTLAKRSQDQRDIEFEIKAEVLESKAGGDAEETVEKTEKDEL